MAPSSVAFVINSATKVSITANDGNAIENALVRGSVTVIKKDTATDTPLFGAVFGLFDISGKELSRGTTDENGTVIFANLPIGEYELRELTAPEGYILSEEPIKFSVTDLDLSLEFEALNEKEPEPPVESPKTGDDTNLLFPIITLLLSAAGLIVVGIYLRKDKQERNNI